ncbi:MAG TPA: DegV family protein [Clostridia bacterium]
MKIKITGDSTLDLTKELQEKYDISLMPLEVTLGENTFLDGVNVTREDIYNFEKQTGKLPKTAARSAYAYKEFFEDFLNQGYDAVIHFNISSLLSASHQSASQAAQELNNVYAVDTLALSTGSSLLAIYAYELAQSGKTPQDIVDAVNKRIPYIQTSFIIDTLHYLYKGGRCSKLQLLGANLLKIKPTIIMKNGKLDVGKKFKGSMGNVIKEYVKYILDTFNTPDLTRVFVTHTDAPAEVVREVKDILKENYAFEEILETTAGATVTAHCGKGTLGILYFNDGKQ